MSDSETRAATQPSAMATQKTIGDREWEMTHMVDAPRDRVWSAWTDPEELKQWYGPRYFTNPESRVDLRPGGEWLVVMRSPEGVDYPSRGIYKEIVEPERLVWEDSFEGSPQEFIELVNETRGQPKDSVMPNPVASATFEQAGDGTKLTLHYRFSTPEDRDAMLKLQMAEGWAESLDVLDEYLGGR